MEDFEIEAMLGITEEEKEQFERFCREPGKLEELHKSIAEWGKTMDIADEIAVAIANSNAPTYARKFIEWTFKDKYKEIFRLHDMLVDAGITHIFRFDPDNLGFQLIYGKYDYYNKDDGCSVVEHSFSYGHEDDKLEICGLLTEKESMINSVAGHLTAEDVYQRIKSHYDRTHDFGTAFEPLTTEEISRILKSTEEE